MFSKRVEAGRSVRVQGCISYKATVDLVGIQGNMDSKCYVDVLQGSLISRADVLFGDNWVLQHDKAVVYTSNVTQCFLRS